jgi:hypothetical protein
MSYKVDCSSLKKNGAKYEKDLKASLKKIVQKSIVAYSTKAAEYIPPDMGKKTIAQKWYKRTPEYLPMTIKQDKNKFKKQDIEALRSGYRYRLIFKKDGKQFPKYYTTLRKAKSHSRIFNRGLFRFAMGGALMQKFSENIPFFKRLLTKSKNLANLTHLNGVQDNCKGENVGYKVSANVKDNERFRGKAKLYGGKQYTKTLKKLWKEWNKKRVEI